MAPAPSGPRRRHGAPSRKCITTSIREVIETGGLGLIDVSTLFKMQKSTHQVKARIHDKLADIDGLLPDRPGQYKRSDIFNSFNADSEITGYEIHMGDTQLLNGTSPFLKIIERSDKEVCMDDGAVSNDGNVIGTYLHGIFDNDEFRLELINHLRKNKGLSPILFEELGTVDKERQYDNLAALFREHINMDLIYGMIGEFKN